MSEIKLSFHLICQDEESIIGQHIRFLLKLASCVKYPVEFIIVDGGSKDSTLKIIDKLKDDRFKIYNNPWPGFAAQRNFAKSKSSGEWTFMIDTDVTTSDNAYTRLNEVLDVGPDVIAYSLPKIHLATDIEHMYNKGLDPMVALFRNIPEISWKGDGLEAPHFKDQLIHQHPHHFNFKWQKYIPDIVMIHFAELKSFEDKIQKCLKYSKTKGNFWFGRDETQIRNLVKEQEAKVNIAYGNKDDSDMICLISERFDDLKFYSEVG